MYKKKKKKKKLEDSDLLNHAIVPMFLSRICRHWADPSPQQFVQHCFYGGVLCSLGGGACSCISAAVLPAPPAETVPQLAAADVYVRAAVFACLGLWCMAAQLQHGPCSPLKRAASQAWGGPHSRKWAQRYRPGTGACGSVGLEHGCGGTAAPGSWALL